MINDMKNLIMQLTKGCEFSTQALFKGANYIETICVPEESEMFLVTKHSLVAPQIIPALKKHKIENLEENAEKYVPSIFISKSCKELCLLTWVHLPNGKLGLMFSYLNEGNNPELDTPEKRVYDKYAFEFGYTLD